MISFKEYITERERTPERAAKLGDYLAKRQTAAKYKEHRPQDRPTTPSIEFAGHEHFDTEGWTDHDEMMSKAWTHAAYIFASRHKNIQEIPLDKIKAMQPSAAFSGKYALEHGFKDDRPINVVGTPDGNYHAVDGHHRWMMHKLLGRKTIKANVQTPKRVKWYSDRM